MKLISNVENAERVKITDTSGNFAADTVEGALKETSEALQTSITITKGPTGFTNNENIIVTYNSVNRTITLTGTFDAYYQNKKITELVSGWTSSPHPDVVANYFLYHDGNNFIWSTTPWTFDKLMIAYVQYNSHKLAIREVHGFMPYKTHTQFHLNNGTYRLSGGDITNYVLASLTATDRRPQISATVVNDEDLTSTINALTNATYTHRYLSGPAARSFGTGQADIIPHAGSRPYWNQNVGGDWQQTQFSNNDYGAVFVVAVPVTADTESQAYRYLFVQPQQVSSDITVIQNLTPMNLVHGESGSLVSEFVFIAKIIVKATSTSWTIEAVEPLFGSRTAQVASPSGNYLTTVNTDASLTGNGTAASPLSAAAFSIAMSIALG